MVKVQICRIRPEQEQEVMATLIYKGLAQAIKLYQELAACRVEDARKAVEALATEIEPAQAS